jgi:hypothetical protein
MAHISPTATGNPKHGAQIDPPGRLTPPAGSSATGEEPRFETPDPKPFRDVIKQTSPIKTFRKRTEVKQNKT